VAAARMRPSFEARTFFRRSGLARSID
jgi:hypothetical protein